jgi:hypothetical protein
MCRQIRALALNLLVISVVAGIASAQDHAQVPGDGQQDAPSLWVTANAGKDHIRFASLEIAQRMRLEILSQSGDIVFNSGFHDGNLLDWNIDDDQGNRLRDDIYGCLITVEDVTGRLSHRRGVFRVANGAARFDVSQTWNLTTAASAEDRDTMMILRDDEDVPIIQLLHDGKSGRISSGRGGLSFRVGNGLAGKDIEYVRLTEGGDLGIGVREPAAKLEVAGLIRTQGIMFPDGSIQRTATAGTGIFAPAARTPMLMPNGAASVYPSTGPLALTLSEPSASTRERFSLQADPGSAGRVLFSEGPSNTLFGQGAGTSLTTGVENSFFGLNAGHATTGGTDPMGSYNSFFGAGAGAANTTACCNDFFGAGAGLNNTTGEGNSFYGDLSGSANIAGSESSFFGREAGYRSVGDYNAFFGSSSGHENTTACCNDFFGAGAGLNNTTGEGNSYFGDLSGSSNTTGGNNAFFGGSSGLSNTIESGNTLLGAHSDGQSGIVNATAIGYRAKVTQGNSLVLGSINTVNGATADTNVGIGTTSPAGRLHVKGGSNELFYVGNDANIGIGTVSPDKRLQIVGTAAVNATLHVGGAGDETKDIFAGMGSNVDTGPAFNYGYAGFSFGRSAGFFNVRPDASATPPNPSLRFMTANQQRMIITNAGRVGIGTTLPQTTLQADGGDIYVGSPGQGIILRSPNGLTCVRLTVDNTGGLIPTVMACP